MRILLLNQVFPPDTQSTGQHLRVVAEALVKQGHDVTVVTGRRAYDNPAQVYPARENWRGMKIIRLWHTGLGKGAKWKLAVDFLTFLVAAMIWGLIQRRFDLVVTLTTPPLLSVVGAMLTSLWRARLVYWVMDLNPDEAVAVGWLSEKGLPHRLLEAASRWSLRRADRIIVLDDYMRHRIEAKGIDSQKIVSIPIWMHREVTFDPEGRERFRRTHALEKKFVVMYSGNHTPCHPLQTLVEAAGLCRNDPQIHFCFIGGGIEWSRWRDQTWGKGWKNVTFIGYQPFHELSASLSAADIQVVVMGDPFVGIIHPCKVYNFLAANRPFLYIGPEPSHITDLIRDAALEGVTASFRHGEGNAVAAYLRRQAEKPLTSAWPDPKRLIPWTESAIVDTIVSVLCN